MESMHESQEWSSREYSESSHSTAFLNISPLSISPEADQLNNRYEVSQLKKLEESINDSPKVQKTAQHDALVNSSTSPIQMSANKTGLPDNLKSGIESLSGYSMDDVRVHYNSSKPAQLQAHAYAQGSEIHLGPGQEQHLPHEAWHVVQQKQGRVKATAQLKPAVQINDDEKLEKEADVMGLRALQISGNTNAAGQLYTDSSFCQQKPLQMARYIKCIQNPDNMAGEITRLTAASPLDAGTFGGTNEYGQPIEINKWLSGGAGISTTHYNPGQMQYYSPVGFVLEVDDENVLGHFEGDGNTSLLHSGRQTYWETFEEIREALTGDDLVNAQIDGQHYTADFADAVTDLNEANTLRGRIENFLANDLVTDEAKARAITLIKTAAVNQLKVHYEHGGFQGAIGPGGPGGLADLEGHLQGLDAGASYHHPDQDRDMKYTESQVHANLAEVVGTFYAAEVGEYPDLINAAWRAGDDHWLANRIAAARNFRQLFVAAGNEGVQVLRLQNGILENAPAPADPGWSWSDIFKWAVATLGGAWVIYQYGWPLLYQLYTEYMEHGGHDEL